MTTEPLTLFPLIACLLIVGLIGFWLFGPSKAVETELNDQGSVLQWCWAKIKAFFAWVGSIFAKKVSPVASAVISSIPTTITAMDNLPVITSAAPHVSSAVGPLDGYYYTIIASGEGSGIVAIPNVTEANSDIKQ